MYAYYQEGEVIVYYQSLIDIKKKKKTSYPIARRLFAMRRYGGGILYAALSLHLQRGCFRIRTHDQQVTKAQLYRCTRARPLKISNFDLKLRTPLSRSFSLCEGMGEGYCTQPYPCICKEAVSGFEPITNKSPRHQTS